MAISAHSINVQTWGVGRVFLNMQLCCGEHCWQRCPGLKGHPTVEKVHNRCRQALYMCCHSFDDCAVVLLQVQLSSPEFTSSHKERCVWSRLLASPISYRSCTSRRQLDG